MKTLPYAQTHWSPAGLATLSGTSPCYAVLISHDGLCYYVHEKKSKRAYSITDEVHRADCMTIYRQLTKHNPVDLLALCAGSLSEQRARKLIEGSL